jgi:hypothetical protein
MAGIKQMVRFLFAAVIAIGGMTCCAYAKTDLSGIKSVAIVSALPSVMYFVKPNMFHYEPPKAVTIDDWKINEHVENRIRSLLSARFEVRQISNMPVNLEGCMNCEYLLPRTSDIDAYIFVSTGVTRTGLMSEATGIEIDYLPRAWEPDKAAVEAIYDLSVIDARTGRILTSEEARLPEAFSWGEHYKLVKELDGSVWPSDAQGITVEQKQALRDAVFGLIDESIPYMIQYMSLDGS